MKTTAVIKCVFPRYFSEWEQWNLRDETEAERLSVTWQKGGKDSGNSDLPQIPPDARGLIRPD